MKTIKAILFSVAFILAVSASAREYPRVTHAMPGTSLLGFSHGDTLRMEIEIPMPGTDVLNSSDRKTSYINTISLVLNNHSNLTEDVKVSISGNILYQIITSDTPRNGPISLEIDFKSGEAEKSTISEAYAFSDAWKVELLITNVTILGAEEEAISDELKIILGQLLEVHVTFQEESFVRIDYNSTVSNLIACNDYRTDEVVIAWDQLPEAEFYELEYTFVDDYTSSYRIHRNPNTNPFNFRDNSTRVSLTESYYRLPRLFERGYLLYRVRAIGRGGDKLQTPVHCEWTNETNAGMLDVFDDKIFLSPHMNDLMNWQASTTFAEEGKRSDVVNYFDGTFRARQTVTGINLGKKDPVFMFEGLTAVTQPGSGGMSGWLLEGTNETVESMDPNEFVIWTPYDGYINLLASVSAIEPATWTPGDGFTPIESAVYTPSTTLVSYNPPYPTPPAYCSKLGSDRVREVIAGETIYDYQGRPAVNVLPVPTNSRKIKFFRRLNISESSNKPYNFEDFDAPSYSCSGPNKLSSNLYSGIMDAAAYYSPNNPNKLGFNAFIPQSEGFPFSQVSYLQDNTGRIAAQSGIGKNFQFGNEDSRISRFYYAAPNQAELDMLFGTEVGDAIRYQKNAVRDPNGQVSVAYLNPAGQTIATALAGEAPENLLPLDHQVPNQISDSLIHKNVPNMDDKTMITEHQFMVSSDNTEYSFSYDILPETLSAMVCDSSICLDCIYDYSLTLNHVESCTSEPLFSFSGTIGELLNDQGQIDLECQNDAGTGDYPHSIIVSLDVGTYNLTKKIQVNEQAALAYVNEILKDTCQFVWQGLLNEALSAIDTMDCYRSCLNCDQPPVPNADCDTAYCKPDMNRCEIIRNMMLADVSPGGQYAAFTRDVNSIVSSEDSLSYFNPGENCMLPSLFFENDKEEKVYALLNDYFPDGKPNNFFTYLVDNWRPEYADSLLPLHPEYCMLGWCDSLVVQETLDFDVLLQSTPYYKDADSLEFVQEGHSAVYELLFKADPWFMDNQNPLDSALLLTKLKNFPCPSIPPPDFPTDPIPIDKIAMQLAYCAYHNPPEDMIDITEGNPTTVKVGVSQINESSIMPCDFPPNYFTYHSFGSDTALADLEWHFLRSLYLSAKNDRIEKSMKKFAESNNCNIRCIGAKKALSHFTFDDIEYPCNLFTSQFLKNKERRFNYGMSVYLNAMLEAGTPLNITNIGDIDDPCAISLAITQQAETINANFSDKYFPEDLCLDVTECDIALALLETMNEMLQELSVTPSGKVIYTEENDLLPDEIIKAGGISNISFFRNIDKNRIEFLFSLTTAWNEIPYLITENDTIAPISLCCIKNLECDSLGFICSFELVVLYNNGVQQSIEVEDYFDFFFNSCFESGSSGGGEISGCDPTEDFDAIIEYLNCVFPLDEEELIDCLPDELINNYYYGEAVSVLIDTADNEFKLTITYVSDGDTVDCPITITPESPIVWDSVSVDESTYNGCYSDCTPKIIFSDGTEASILAECWGLCLFTSTFGGGGSITRDLATLDCEVSSFNEFKLYSAPRKKNPCVDKLKKRAYANAALYYWQWVDSMQADLLARYYAKCMDATESLNMAYIDKQYHYTLYYYDQAGNLVKTIPPAGVEILSDIKVENVQASRAADYNAAVLPGHFKQTVYHYNTLNLPLRQKTPDAGESIFLYDGLGRIAASQNARQKAESAFSYLLYDKLGRVVESGKVKQSPFETLESQARDFAAWSTFISHQANRTEITSTQYDTPYTTVISQKFGSGGQRNLRSRVATVMHFENSSKLQGKEYTHASHYSYDIAGNVYKMIQDYPNGEIGDKVFVYDFDLQSGKVNSLTYQPDKADQFIHRYGYDAANRLIKVETSENGLHWDTDAEYFYYRHGPLARLELGSDKVQGLDYLYTLQGFIKGVNGTSLSPETDMGRDGLIAEAGQGGAQPAIETITINGQTIQVFVQSQVFGSSFNGPGYGAMHNAVARDAFGYVLDYFEEDYKPVSPNTYLDGLNQTSGQVKYLYNGNIARMYTQLQKLGNAGFNYRYDQLNRLISQEGWKLNNGSMEALGQAYTMNLSYDPDGNILTLNRNGHAGNLEMDELSYRYYAADGSIFEPTLVKIPKNATNRLAGVSDAVPAGKYPENNYTFGTVTDVDKQSMNNNYKYDAIGNLISDHAEGITNISWNLQNKVSRIEKTNGTLLEFAYDALGNRVMKAVKGTNTDLKTWYVRDAQGNTLAVYTKNELAPEEEKGLRWTEAHLYGSSRLGLYKPDKPISPATTGPPTTTLGDPGFIDPGNVQYEQGTGTGGPLTPQTIYVQILPYKTTRGYTHYELSNHLGNVLATISDRKLPATDENGLLSYTADLTSAQDYYAFGMLMPERSFNSNLYRYGLNGMEKDDEIKGSGNSFTTYWRQYDPRLVRWLSYEPKPVAWESPYSAFRNNPIIFNDPAGDTPKIWPFGKDKKQFNHVKKAKGKNSNGSSSGVGRGSSPKCKRCNNAGEYIKDNIISVIPVVPEAAPGSVTYNNASNLVNNMERDESGRIKLYLTGFQGYGKTPEQLKSLTKEFLNSNGQMCQAIYDALIQNLIQKMANAMVLNYNPLISVDNILMTSNDFRLNQNAILVKRASIARFQYLYPGLFGYRDSNLMSPKDHAQFNNFPDNFTYVAFKTQEHSNVIHFIQTISGSPVGNWQTIPSAGE